MPTSFAGARTLLVEQRLIDGAIVPGQKVRHFRPRAVDLVAPLKQDLAEHRLRMGRPDGLIVPRRDGRPWLRTDVNNWRRRVWHGSRDAAGAEQLGHAPQMTLATATADLDDDFEDTARRATIMRALERVESEPSILGASPHLMAIATKGLTGHSRCAPRRRPPADGELSGLPSVWFAWRMHAQTVNRSR